MDQYLKVLKKYAVFHGRAGRREFWMFTLWTLAFMLLCLILDHALEIDTIAIEVPGSEPTHVGPLLITYFLATFVPGLAVQCRRLHDIGRTGWLQLIGVIPYIGTIVIAVLCAKPGTTGPNKYGHDPNFGEPPSDN
jgi:uncharacterized membrane protein YhaH (DUF805 family)